MNWFATPQLIHDRLVANADIVAAVANRVHYMEVPSSSTYPRIWFTRTSKAKLDNLNPSSITVEQEVYAFEVFSDKNVDELIHHLTTTLEQLAGETVPGTTPLRLIQLVQVQEATDDYQYAGIEPGKELPKFYHSVTAQLSIVHK